MNPKLKAVLRRCREKKFLVEFDRDPRISECITGFVVGFSDSLVLLHLLDWNTFTLNGYIVIREQDITGLSVLGKDSWQSKAARVNKLNPIQPSIALSSIADVMVSASKGFPLVAIEKELVANDKKWIGRLARLTKKTVVIRGLNPNAVWIKESKFSLSEITRVEFGGGYEAALALSARTLRNT